MVSAYNRKVVDGLNFLSFEGLGLDRELAARVWQLIRDEGSNRRPAPAWNGAVVKELTA